MKAPAGSRPSGDEGFRCRSAHHHDVEPKPCCTTSIELQIVSACGGLRVGTPMYIILYIYIIEFYNKLWPAVGTLQAYKYNSSCPYSGSRGLAVAACPWLKLHQIRQKTDPPLLQHWHPKAYLAGCFCGWLISLFTPLSMLLDDSPWPCFVSSC